ncbi:MAG: FtsW/RodA/SpoVE family cell cycle protein [Parachlamydiales bacterium]|jgi:rod shape determining protein RodA
MWHHKYLFRIDLRLILIVLLLMAISLAVIYSMTGDLKEEAGSASLVKNQLEWFLIGFLVFLFFSALDYQRLKDFSWFLYVLMFFLLLGLYFASPIQSVHRWYRLPLIGLNVQPSEYAKLVVVVALGWFLEKKKHSIKSFATSLQVLLITGIPFFLILKQPDLGTALVLFPITLVMCYLGEVQTWVVRTFVFLGAAALLVVVLMFSGTLSHEKMRPFFTNFLKEYQYERLNPDTYHQKAAQIAIAIGGLGGKGWQKSEFSAKRWLPAAHTDSVFAAFGEEFGLIGMVFLVFLFFSLIYLCFQVAKYAKDSFGRLLASGIAVYLAMHVVVNVGMMCGFLPIAGVPLPLVSYGGNAVITTMAALGVIQSIYTRRFMF